MTKLESNRNSGIILPEVNSIAEIIPLNKIYYDAPVDEIHVETLKAQLQASGQLSPITLWRGRNEIIDGFHRCEAMRQLGIRSAKCLLVSLSEEEFYDARITSAKAHQGVQFSRVVIWTRQVFSRTPWAEKLGMNNISLAFRAEEVGRYTERASIHKELVGSGLLTEEEVYELYNWVMQKATIWGLSPLQVSKMLALAQGVPDEIIAQTSPTGPFTRAHLRHLVNHVPDPQARQEIIERVIRDELKPRETLYISRQHAQATTPQEQHAAIHYDFSKKQRPTYQEPVLTEAEKEQRRREHRHRQEASNLIYYTQQLTDLTKFLTAIVHGDFNTESHPREKSMFNTALANLLIVMGRYQNLLSPDTDPLLVIGTLQAELEDAMGEIEFLKKQIEQEKSSKHNRILKRMQADNDELTQGTL